jgi:type I restriction enzyme S subunit
MKDWQSNKFEECIESVKYTTKVQRKDFLDAGEYPIVSQEEAYINGFWNQETDLFRIDRPIVVFGDHTRALKYIDFDFVLGADGVKVLKPKPFLHPRFFYYQLHTAKLDSLGYARHYRLLKEHNVAYPAYAEQRRIVAILDEAFEAIATAKANAEKNLQSARCIFDDFLRDVFSRRGVGWVDRTLDDVCKVERGSSPRPIKSYFTTAEDGVNWIKIGDTEEGGKYIFSTAQKITPEGAKQSRYVKEGDFILTNSMSFGRPYIMKTTGYIHDGWFVLRLRDVVDTDYFYYLLSSNCVQQQFASLAAGAVVKNISGDLVKRAVLAIPPLVEQQVLVEKFVSLEEATDSLAEKCQQKLATLDDLKKSLLHHAFTGQLTGKSADQLVGAVA